ncbi:tRNA glutamyl-Q(34) synthetase GluQRS [Prosthecodimorpha staleyi]|uniref:tRNA glutamyl-Q(34) synthetase GluQRS n=1 Tax=Prosthecodimorpha staleyi TaxID=2840188 RepID=A0A947GC92_9HYPH|nr:tRNA glutamyl-Q(34) synthetase GluQRS [Prosthecodimorpha staleyi]MBT9291123.1 tRNA glutamyl-Q(34) synthetase GluQRS [Prosthecodimorpha staleyi]
MTRPVFRFAPSPNGDLHLGHAFSALTDFRAANAAGGRFLLRMEDIDTTRCRPEFEAGILADLAWLGLRWETPVRRQSEHFADYAAALARLTDIGLVYPAFLSRGAIKARVEAAEADGRAWPRDPDGAPLDPGDDRDLDAAEAERRIAAGAPFAWRLRMAKACAAAGDGLAWQEEGEGPGGETGRVAAEPERWGDVILARRDTPTSYHLAVVVDDALQGVTHVVRGRDLFHATSVHRLLQRLLGLPEPVYRHHRLILDGSGRKLSKSLRDTSLAALRASGATPADICRMVGLEPEAEPNRTGSVSRTERRR